MLSPRQYPALVLNADFQPLSYYPLSLMTWQESVKAVFLERVAVVAEYSRAVRSASLAMALPSVVSLKRYAPPAPRPAFTRFNVFLRDGFACQYCGVRRASEELTFDHVVPRSKGGISSWENVVTACRSCNLAKGARPAAACGMALRAAPARPSWTALQRQGRRFPQGYLHESWADFLYWDSELER